MNGYGHDEKAVLEDEALARRLQAEEEDEQLARTLQDEMNTDHGKHYHPVGVKSPLIVSDDHGSDKKAGANGHRDEKAQAQAQAQNPLPAYAPPPGLPPSGASGSTSHRHPSSTSSSSHHHVTHSNPVVEAGRLRSVDEQQMQNWLQTLQYKYRIYNAELEPEHEADYPCSCDLHQYQRAKWGRSKMQDMWNQAVLYPGEKAYNSNRPYNSTFFSGNPYQYKVVSPYFASMSGSWGPKRASSRFHATWITQTIALNNSLNAEAQRNIDAREPKVSIWGEGGVSEGMAGLSLVDKPGSSGLSGEKNGVSGEKGTEEKGHGRSEQNPSSGPAQAGPSSTPVKKSKFSGLRKSMGMKSTEEKQAVKEGKQAEAGVELRDAILTEESGRWPTPEWRAIVDTYQEKTGMAKKIADLRMRHPIQYLHLLRAGYFEPIPVAWAQQASNPLKFSIEAAAGWRGITPAWRGYEDTAEERLYWVLNHREGSTGTRLKPDFISALDLARERAATAVPPPPEYYDAQDTCHTQHTTDGYSKQVMPAPFKAYDRPETATDDTMILLDVSGSMDFEPQRPNYDRYLITGYQSTNQPKNKDLAKAIIRRFTDAMTNHDHLFSGYDLTTFSSTANYIGTVNHQNLEALWKTVKIGGGTRVMVGWQKIKDLHFQKHSHSAIHHPVYGWQAGPDTPMLRLLLLLDGEATDMDEFELDLLGLSWAHVTIFLIGVDGCPHHHRHANELQRISDVNHRVSFVDAQGNTPERFVTHELLKRHLGYELSMAEFQDIELPPTYNEATR